MAESIVVRGRIEMERGIRAHISMENAIKDSAIQMLPVFPPQYTGPTTITPGPEAQAHRAHHAQRERGFFHNAFGDQREEGIGLHLDGETILGSFQLSH